VEKGSVVSLRETALRAPGFFPVPIDGCYACPDFDSCTESMPHGKRNQAFNRYAREFGLDALVDRLRVNYENGITYHTPDKTSGDYNTLETHDEIYQLLRYGRNNPYINCPQFDTERFHLRQVRMEDAEELLCFYGDLSEWMFYGNEMSNSIFASRHATLEEMRKCIAVWLDEYRNKYYIRFSVIDKTTQKAIGTIEVFDNAGKDDSYLHIDLSSPYENQSYISELLMLADKELFKIFNIKNLLIQAIPSTKERIAALQAFGYQPFECKTGGTHYYMKEKVK
jgi:RimJ/RimL family protein N-acetyltransferase